jgi:hypothetical protein
MREHWQIVLVVNLLAAFGAPLALGVSGLVGGGREVPSIGATRPPWPWRLVVASALAFALAFNLVFFVQELCLVLPKAVTPGLHPVLFHNNHDWTGSNPLAEVEQGAGVLADLVVGLAAAGWLARRPGASASWRLLVFWIAFCGLFSALPQVVAASMLGRQDISRAFTWLGLPPAVIWGLAALALVAMAVAGRWLVGSLLALADDPARVASRSGRSLFVFQAAVLPGLAGVLLVLPFRVPGEVVQVAVVPAVIAVVGLVWLQAWAWRVSVPALAPVSRQPAILIPLAALAVMLAVFQLILRPGVAF